jgi:dienelactone hydrolase
MAMMSARRGVMDFPILDRPRLARSRSRQFLYHSAMSAARTRWLAAAVALLGLAVWIASPYVATAAFLLDLAGSTSWVRRTLPVRVQPVTTRDIEIPTRTGPVAARVYQPASPASRSLIVFPGIHGGGVDEPRLVAFSRRLAASGATVVSVPVPDLRAYRITPAATDVIEDATAWMTGDRALAPDGRVGLVGVSFAGGLALVAAGRPSLAGKLQVVVSLGGHADLPRTMAYLCTGQLPGESPRPPHDYGVVIILLAALDRVVPASEVVALRHAVVTFLDASSAESTDRVRAQQLFEQARVEEDALPEPAREWMGWVNARNVAALGSRLLPYVEALGGAPALSPDRSPATSAPVFLLHGALDNVIPASETSRLAAYLGERGNARVDWLLTPLVSHANILDGAPVADVWRLVRFWTRLRGVS